MAPVADGYWGNVTSTIDWCESNYEVTWYIAEFWNTISNLSMILPALHGMHTSWRDKLGTRFIYCYVCLLVVGIGSWCFHMTLLFEMQLLDEIPMIWGQSCMLYCIQVAVEPKQNRHVLLMISLVIYAIVLTWMHVALNLVVMFQAAFALLVFLSIYSAYKLSKTKYFDRKYLYLGVGLYVFGFFLWNIDNLFCGHLRKVRSILPFPVTGATQLHGWWHLFSGYTTYLNILACCHARLKYQQIESKVQWGLLGISISRPAKSYLD